MSHDVFDQRIDELAKLGKPKIAFGLKGPDEEILASLETSKKYAEIVLVGPNAIKDVHGFEVIVNDNPEEKIATMLVEEEVAGIVRGTIDDFTTFEKYKELTGEDSNLTAGLFQDPQGRKFFMTPASNTEGWDREERYEKSKTMAEFIKDWGVEPKIAIFAGTRHETYPRKKHIKEGVVGILNKTYEDAEWIVEKLTKDGFNAKNWAIDLNPAVEDGCNVIIPVNGMVGNQILRVLLFCGGAVLTATRLGLSKLFENNSRTEKDFEYHIKWLVALINKSKQ